MKQYKKDSVLNRIIENTRKKQAKKDDVKYMPLTGRPSSKMVKQLLRNQLRISIRKNINKRRAA